MSTKTGLAPVLITDVPDDGKLNEGIITSSGPKFANMQAISKA